MADDDDFSQHLIARWRAVSQLPGADLEGLADVLHVLQLLIDVNQAFPDALLRSRGVETAFSKMVEPTLNELTELVAKPKLSQLLRWCRDVCISLVATLNGYLEGDSRTEGEAMSVRNTVTQTEGDIIQYRIREEAERFKDGIETVLESAKESATAAAEAAETAQESAGTAGAASLSEYFEKYATGERVAANGFRIATIATILIAVGLAIWLPRPPTDDIPGVLYRLAVVLGVGALSGYFGRQAGQHRRVYNWAKGIQVQLQSFPAFIQPVKSDDVSGQIYAAFAAKVLGSLPERPARGSDPNAIGPAQLIEMVSALVKKT